MARKPRDYKAEERRRNELARQRGFTSRAQQRRAIETGKIPALQPKRVRSPKTVEAQKRRVRPPKARGPIQTDFNGYTIPVEQQAKDWSTLHARSEIAQYRPEEAAKLGVGKKAYTNAYMRAFVVSDGGYSAVRYAGGSPELYYWFVTLNQYMSASEYETRYGPVA